MNTQQELLLASIERNPLDQLTRCAYADWLDENDYPEHADRQRKWVEAYHYLKEFTSERYNYECDEKGDEIPGTGEWDYDKVMSEIEYWKNAVTGKNSYGLSFSTNYAQDTLEKGSEARKKFWGAFEVITGVVPPEKIREQEWYHCAC